MVAAAKCVILCNDEHLCQVSLREAVKRISESRLVLREVVVMGLSAFM
jgi:hypothetical protein